MRLLFTCLVTVLAVLGLATPSGAAGQNRFPVRPLTVLSYNIHHGAGPDGAFDLDRIAGVIRASRADVVGLQEVDRHFGERSAWTDEPAELAERLGMHVVYGANLDLEPPAPGQPRRQYGTAILSRYPIVSWQNTLLPKGTPTEEQRGLLEAVLDVRGMRVRVMTTHFQHDNAASRLLQARVVAEAVEAAREPILLTGDLNAPPHAPEVTTLTAAMTDTHARTDRATYPAEAPVSRIDYVLATRATTLFTRVPAVDASDHLPVLTALVVWRAGHPG